MTTTAPHAIMAPVIRPLQESPVSRPRAVYSIDQILGNQTKRSGKFSRFILKEYADGGMKLLECDNILTET